jgi:hypothetical protein
MSGLRALDDEDVPPVNAVSASLPYDGSGQRRQRKRRKEPRTKEDREVSEQEYNAACTDVYDRGERKQRICGETHIVDRES